MRLLGFGVLLLAWSVIIIGGISAGIDFRRDYLRKKWLEETRFIPTLDLMGTFRKARR